MPTTFWVEEEELIELGSVSWDPAQTGRSREGLEELDEIVGQGHNFTTVKPLNVARRSGWEDSDNQDENPEVAAMG